MSGGAVLGAAALVTAGCAVADDGPRTPSLPSAPPAEEVLTGRSSSSIVDGWACYVLTVDGKPVELIAPVAASSEPGADYLVGEGIGDGSAAVGRVWEASGSFVTGAEYDARRGACPVEDRYFAVATVVVARGG